MKNSIIAISSFVSALICSSCSCAIRSESWKHVSGRFDSAAVKECAIATGFRPDGEHLKKQDSYLRIAENGRRIDLQSFWCPFPRHLIFMKTSIRNWEQRTDTIRDEFLQETRKRGIRLRNDQT